MVGTVAKTPSSNDLNSTLARDWSFQVDLNDDAADPNWTYVRGLSQFAPSFTPGMQDDSDIDSNGFTSQIATTQTMTFEGEGKRKGKLAADKFTQDPGQEYLREVGRQMGLRNTLRGRAWRTDGVDMAYEGRFSVEYTETAGGNDALDQFSFKLQSRGEPTRIKPVETDTAESILWEDEADPGNP